MKPYLKDHAEKSAEVGMPIILHTLAWVTGHKTPTDDDIALARQIEKSYLDMIGRL